MNNAALLGKNGEQCVEQWLIDKGYAVVARNSRCRQGEIDVVAVKGDTVACIEVKTRTNILVPFGVLVPPSKQRKITQAALHFLQQHQKYQNYTIRFDICFVSHVGGHYRVVEYITHAFEGVLFT